MLPLLGAELWKVGESGVISRLLAMPQPDKACVLTHVSLVFEIASGWKGGSISISRHGYAVATIIKQPSMKWTADASVFAGA